MFYNTDEETINEYIEDDELDKMMKEGDYPSEMFAINLDEQKIIFVEGVFGDLHVYDLIEGKIPMSVGKYTQTIFDLDGSKFDYLFTYYDKGEEYDHLTTAIYIVTEDGEEYYAETKDKDLAKSLEKLSKSEQAKVVGKTVAEKAIAKGITEIVFDRGGYLFTGRVKALADGAREAGLRF